MATNPPSGRWRPLAAAATLLAASVPLIPGATVPSRAASVQGAVTYDVSADGRAITPAGTVYRTTGSFAAGLTLDGAATTVFVANASKFTDAIQAFSTAAPQASSAAVPLNSLNPPPGELPEVQSGELHLGPDGQLYDAGGASGAVRVFSATQPVAQTAFYQVGTPNPLSGPATHAGYIGDVAPLPDGRTLIATEPFTADGGQGHTVVRYSTAAQAVTASATVGAHPFAVAADPVGTDPPVAVASQDSGTVSVLDPATMRPLATVDTGRQPAALAFTHDGSELLVVDSLDDSVAVVDTRTWTVTQRIDVGVEAGLGASPNAIAVAPSGTAAYVSDAADNAIAVLHRSGGAGWALAGFIPTARYPTGVALAAGSQTLWVTVGKAGSATVAGSIPSNLGALEQIPVPSAASLADDTAQVRADDVVAPTSCGTGAAAGIRHVVLIIRENKTFDAEFGDLPGGDPAYLEYGRQTTPNAHALAERYALLQNFNGDEEVSDTGHQVLMGSVANDWDQRQSEQAYNLGGAPRPGAELGNDDDTLWAPNDYLFDDVLAHHVSFLDYGEFYRRDQATDGPVSPELGSHIETGMPGFGFDPGTPDTRRVAYWRQQFAQQLAGDRVPSLTVLYLPEDHTTTVDNGVGSAQTQVADNDLATGQVVDTLSHSRIWSSSVVFVEEDDSQDDMDHIDPHRSLALVIGPHVRPGVSTAVPYDQLSVLRTIELILGVPPLTEHDATARPMLSLLTATPPAGAEAPYGALTPNPPTATPATLRAVARLSRATFGPHPTAAQEYDSHARAEFLLQWLAVHNRPFRASARTPGVGGPAMIDRRARARFLEAARAQAATAAPVDCPTVPSRPAGGSGSAGGFGTPAGPGTPTPVSAPMTHPRPGGARPGGPARQRSRLPCRGARGIGLVRPPGPRAAAVSVVVRIDGRVRLRRSAPSIGRFRLPWPTPVRFRLTMVTRFADGERILTTVAYDGCRRGRVVNRRLADVRPGG